MLKAIRVVLLLQGLQSISFNFPAINKILLFFYCAVGAIEIVFILFCHKFNFHILTSYKSLIQVVLTLIQWRNHEKGFYSNHAYDLFYINIRVH